MQMPNSPQGKRQDEKVRRHVPHAAQHKGQVHVGAAAGQPGLADLGARDAGKDQAADAGNVEQHVGVDEDPVDPVDAALVHGQEDLVEEEEDGELGEADAEAVDDRGDVFELEGGTGSSANGSSRAAVFCVFCKTKERVVHLHGIEIFLPRNVPDMPASPHDIDPEAAAVKGHGEDLHHPSVPGYVGISIRRRSSDDAREKPYISGHGQVCVPGSALAVTNKVREAWTYNRTIRRP